MNPVQFWAEKQSMTALRPLVGIWRHDNLICKPGLYCVAPCLGNFAPVSHAVMDDFGNLVRVS